VFRDTACFRRVFAIRILFRTSLSRDKGQRFLLRVTAQRPEHPDESFHPRGDHEGHRTAPAGGLLDPIRILVLYNVQIIRSRLTEQGIHDSWASLRKIFQVQRRVTSSFKTREGRTLNVRKASLPEPEPYPALPSPVSRPEPRRNEKVHRLSSMTRM
jgi:hypothetical protein